MKKILAVLALCLLAGCSGKETIEADYVYSNHNDIVDQVLGDPLDKDEALKILDGDDSIELYYDNADDEQIILYVFNNMDYYYTGTIELDACEFKLSVSGMAPHTHVTKTVECPEFEEDSQFSYNGQLFERNEENAYRTAYEVFGYEEDDTLYDYVLNLTDISDDELKALAHFLYTEIILGNYEGEMWVRVYPKDAYDEAIDKNTDEAWNDLDANHTAGKILIDAENKFAEIYKGNSSELLEKIDFR